MTFDTFLPDSWLTFNDIDLIPKSLRWYNSDFWLIPSPLISLQTRILSYAESFSSITPSEFESYCDKALNPPVALLPSGIFVEFPNNSVPSSIMPFPLISIASKASSGETHAVFSTKFFASSSKYTPLSAETVSKPSLSKSRTSGSTYLIAPVAES